MSMEKRRDELGKLLACLLVSRKGQCSIRDLERDYKESDGRNIPYKEFGCYSAVDFFRSISKHIRLESRFGEYVLYPVVSDKTKHVVDLVSKQKPGKRSTPVRRRGIRSSRCYPHVSDPKPFIPNTVQQEIAKILTANPSGVNKAYIAQRLEQSKAVVGTIDSNNIDDYLKSMPYIAYSSGNMVYPKQSLTSTSKPVHSNTSVEVNGFEIVTPRDSDVHESSLRNNNTYERSHHPAGESDYEDDEFDQECEETYAANINQSQPRSRTGNDDRPKVSSAEFIDRARLRFQQLQPQYDTKSRENNNLPDNYHVESKITATRDLQENYTNADCTYVSEGEPEIDIINSRLKSRLQTLIQKNPNGIWCADLLQTYLNEYRVPLDYSELGFGSVCALASQLPSIFRLHRLNDRGDFKLYDATKPLPESANEPEFYSQNDAWENDPNDDDGDPFPMAGPTQTDPNLVVPANVMTYGESVGQERIPDEPDVYLEPYNGLEVYIADVFSPSLFWIHLRRKRNKLNHLMRSMHDFYQEEGEKYTIPHIILEKGLNCVCIFDDKWHRAIIKTVKPDGNVTVIFYDFGTTKTYPPDSLRFLDRRFSNLPAQAIACGLYNIKPVNSHAWTRGVSAEFYAKVRDIPLFAMIVKVDKENNSMLVSLADTRTKVDLHINDWLVEQGFAELGSMGDTVVFECSYLDDQVVHIQDASTATKTISPLAATHLDESGNTTLRPPPGITKPAQPMDYAAFMDECMNRTGFNTSQLGSPGFSNFGDINSNSSAYSLLTQPETLLQFWKQSIELTAAVNKLLLSNTSALLNTNVNGINIPSPASSINPFTEPVTNNPFKNYVNINEPDISAILKQTEETTENLKNLSVNNSDNFFVHNSTTLWNSDEQNVSGKNPNFSTPNELNSVLSNTKDLEDLTLVNESQPSLSRDENSTLRSSPEHWHDTNPFKSCLFGESQGQVESPLKTDPVPPPIPPRKRDAAKKTEPKIYYTARPIMYNSNKSDNLNVVSSDGLDLTHESLNKNTLFNFGESNPTQYHPHTFMSSFHSHRHTSEINSSSTLPKELSTDNSPYLRPRIMSNTYRPPPPPYVKPEYQYDKKKPISPRFVSPVISQSSKAAIEAVQSVLDLKFFDKVESVVTNTSDDTTRHDNTMTDLNNRDNQTSSLSNISKSSSYFYNMARGNKSQTIKLIIPKFLQGETPNVNNERVQDESSLRESNVPTETVPKLQEFLSTSKENLTVPWSTGTQESYNMNGTSAVNLEKPENCRSSFPAENLGNGHTYSTIEASSGGPITTNNNPLNFGNMNSTYVTPVPANLEKLENCQRSFQAENLGNGNTYSTMEAPSRGPITTDNNPLNFGNMNTTYVAPPPHSFQQAPPNTRYFVPQYTHPGLNHPYQTYHPPGMMQPSPANQRIPLFRPNGFHYASSVQWPRSGIFYPSHPLPHNNAPPFIPQWNSYNTQMFARPTMHGRRRMATTMTAPEPQPDNKKDTVGPMTSDVLKNSQSVTTADSKNIAVSTQLSASIPVKNEQKVLENEVEELVNKNSYPTQEFNGTQTPPPLPPRNQSPKWTNENFIQVSQDDAPKAVDIFKPIEVNGQTIHIFNILNEGWVCTEEILLTFTPFKNRHTVLKILDVMKININFMEVSRADSPQLFNELDSTNLRLPRMTNSKRIKSSLHLTPLNLVINMMYYLNIITEEEVTRAHLNQRPLPGSKLPDLGKLLRAYKTEFCSQVKT